MLFYESERSDQHNYLYCQRDHNFNFPAHLHHSFEFLCVQSGTLTGAGFEHYEVSNYALPGCRARHNAAYWSGDEYLGIGPAAHSFNGKSRRWAAASIDGYLAGAGTEAIYEQERLTERDRYNEYLMTRLRTAEGLELAAVETRFGKERAERLLRQAEPFMGIGELCFAAGRLAIPEIGRASCRERV